MNINPDFDVKAMEEYLALKEKEEYFIKVNLTHSILTKINLQEIKYDRRTTISDVKKDLEYRYGSKVENMNLHLKDA